jgi:hypothetical protein
MTGCKQENFLRSAGILKGGLKRKVNNLHRMRSALRSNKFELEMSQVDCRMNLQLNAHPYSQV